jgi:hypothetical protein
MVLMVQMLSTRKGRGGSRAGVLGHDLPTAPSFGARESLVRTGFHQLPAASTSLLAGERLPRKTREGASVEVKIGITDSPRELVFNSAQTPSEVEELVTAALGKDSDVLSLTDEKGRRFLIHTAKIAYVEIGAADARRVGFGIGSGSARHA